MKIVICTFCTWCFVLLVCYRCNVCGVSHVSFMLAFIVDKSMRVVIVIIRHSLGARVLCLFVIVRILCCAGINSVSAVY